MQREPQTVDSVTSATPGSGGQLTIAEFLLARIAEDDAVAHAMIEASEMYPYGDKRFPRLEVSDIPDQVRGYLGGTWGEHFARHDPRRVLDECASKRAIIELAEQVESMDHQIANEWGGSAGTAESILSALAAVYEHHPDYQKEWGNGN